MNTFDKIYKAVKRIPYGKVATYGQIARICGNARMSRVVGYALHVNPSPETIPCFRVVNREGCTATAFAFGGACVQRQLLEQEGVEFDENGNVLLDKFLWNLDIDVIQIRLLFISHITKKEC